MERSKFLWIILFLVLACLLVSCKTKDNIIKIIKYNQQASEITTEEPIRESEKPLKKPSFIENKVSPEESPKSGEIQDEEWKQIYLDLLDYSIVESEYGDYLLFDDKINGIENIMLYDLDHDGIPELFVEGGYESTCIYSIKDSKVTFLDEIIPGSIDIRKDLNTNKETLCVSSLLEGDGGVFYLSTVDMESGNIVYEILFGKFWSSNESLDEYYLNVKDSMESLDQAFMDYENRQVSKDIYEEAIENFEDSHEIIEEIILYNTPIYDVESFDVGLEMFRDALDDYVLNKD